MPDEPRDAGDVPLFIKVPGYQNILRDLVGVQQILANMRESIEVLNEVEAVKQRSIEVFRENVERLNQELVDVEQELPEMHDMDVHIDAGQMPASQDNEEVVDEAIKDLRGELEHLRDDLDNIE